MTKIKSLLTNEDAQGMVEYILIIALVAIVAIAALKMFGGKIIEWFQKSADKIDKGIGG